MLIKTNDLPHVIEIVIDDEITEEDIQEFEDYFSQKKETQEKVNMLIDIRDIDYSLDGFIADTKFTTSHLEDFNKVAMVSDDKWIEYAEKVAQLMPEVEVAHFDPDQRDKAIAWLS
ncbi:SpoIIAA-like [Alkalibacterium subtropicum]|uniref:SpoIIAA-like n=1 Tax=Alkalibacterium subtropicum TaxID=753702 RepID=A0A1I1I0K5_9LACT|nr:STAS/SEC14 domain-containing protein [Alkalibacterium subtropicum]SFC29959.1 SpoIIAA-like [Alkalibacterium subtropicum]